MRKRSEAVYRQRWLEAEANMEIYSVAQVSAINPPPSRVFVNFVDCPKAMSHGNTYKLRFIISTLIVIKPKEEFINVYTELGQI